jgi:hypothetical protein
MIGTLCEDESKHEEVREDINMCDFRATTN